MTRVHHTPIEEEAAGFDAIVEAIAIGAERTALDRGQVQIRYGASVERVVVALADASTPPHLEWEVRTPPTRVGGPARSPIVRGGPLAWSLRADERCLLCCARGSVVRAHATSDEARLARTFREEHAWAFFRARRPELVQAVRVAHFAEARGVLVVFAVGAERAHFYVVDGVARSVRRSMGSASHVAGNELAIDDRGVRLRQSGGAWHGARWNEMREDGDA